MSDGHLVWIKVLKGCWQEVFEGDIVQGIRRVRTSGEVYIISPNWGEERWALYNSLDEPEFQILSPLELLAGAAE